MQGTAGDFPERDRGKQDGEGEQGVGGELAEQGGLPAAARRNRDDGRIFGSHGG